MKMSYNSWSADTVATVFLDYQKRKLLPYTKRKSRYFYLWDLRNGLPDSISSGDKSINPEFYVTIPSGDQFSFYNGDFDLVSYQKSLFDTLHVRFNKYLDTVAHREIFQFKNAMSPIRNSLKITLKPRHEYGDKSAVYAISGSKLSYIGGEKQVDGTYSFETRDLGYYTIDYDTIPPEILPINWSPSNLKMKISDNNSGVKKYGATINGQFLLMRYDAKEKSVNGNTKRKRMNR